MESCENCKENLYIFNTHHHPLAHITIEIVTSSKREQVTFGSLLCLKEWASRLEA